MPDRRSTNFLQEYSFCFFFFFFFFSKAFIALNVFIQKFHYFMLFCVFFMAALKIVIILS